MDWLKALQYKFCILVLVPSPLMLKISEMFQVPFIVLLWSHVVSWLVIYSTHFSIRVAFYLLLNLNGDAFLLLNRLWSTKNFPTSDQFPTRTTKNPSKMSPSKPTRMPTIIWKTPEQVKVRILAPLLQCVLPRDWSVAKKCGNQIYFYFYANLNNLCHWQHSLSFSSATNYLSLLQTNEESRF